MTTTTIDVDTLTDTPRHSITTDAAQLTTLLKAVLPHTDTTEDQPAIHRVRLTVNPQLLEAQATSRYTAVIARITGEQVETQDHDPHWTIDLYPTDLAVIAKMFKPGKDEQITLRIDHRRDDRATITDVSGLFDGRAYTIPTVGHPEDFPDIRRILTGIIDSPRGIVGAVTYTGDLLRRFAASAAAYNQPLHLEPTAENQPFLVTIGDNLIGALMPIKNDDEVNADQLRLRREWRTHLA